MARPLLLEWHADARKFRFEKRHASRRLEEMLEREGVRDCVWVWESRGDRHRLCVSCGGFEERVCQELSTDVLRHAASGDAESEVALQRAIRALVRRIKSRAGADSAPS